MQINSQAETRRTTRTFAAFKNPNFRLYFFGQLISTSGTWMQNIAQGYLVFQLTKSELWLGIVACAAGLPLIFLSPVAGVVVERIPRRNLLLVSQVVQMTLALILTALVFLDAVQIWHIVVLALILGLMNAFDAPSRMAIISDLVVREELQSGIAMNSIIFNGSRVFGPTLAGLVLASLGAGWCFFLNSLSFLVMIVILLLLHISLIPEENKRVVPLQQLQEGLRYARSHEHIWPLLLVAATTGFFSVSLISLMPAFAADVLKSARDGYALISATNGLGAIIGGLSVSILIDRLGRGRWLSILTFMTPLSIFLLSLVDTVFWASIISVFVGFSMISQLVTINTTIQLMVPNTFRGRVMSLYTLCVVGLTPFGSLLLGFLAEEIGISEALVVYALFVAVLVYLILHYWPSVRQLASDPMSNVRQEAAKIPVIPAPR
jgi:MFS family permease